MFHIMRFFVCDFAGFYLACESGKWQKIANQKMKTRKMTKMETRKKSMAGLWRVISKNRRNQDSTFITSAKSEWDSLTVGYRYSRIILQFFYKITTKEQGKQSATFLK